MSHDKDILTIAITTTLYVSVHPILELVRTIRENNTTAKIIVGGPYISNLPKMTDTLTLQHLFKYIGADLYVINSEGEAALINIIDALAPAEWIRTVEHVLSATQGYDLRSNPRFPQGVQRCH